MQEYTYQLRINVTIERLDRNGSCGGNRLTVSEDQELTVASFAESALVLGRFHELAEQLKKNRIPEDSGETRS